MAPQLCGGTNEYTIMHSATYSIALCYLCCYFVVLTVRNPNQVVTIFFGQPFGGHFEFQNTRIEI